jgi:N-acetylglucosamine kinase-like BadF-type ATPase
VTLLAQEPAILAVDGGNSKTDVALVAVDGSLLAAVRGPTASHQQVGLVAGADRIAALVDEARRAANLPDVTPLARVGAFALAGADTPADTRRLTNALLERRLTRRVEVVNDAFVPIRSGSERGWGVVVICGSGVNAAGIGPTGRRARLAALGPISGDWGGASGVGEAGLGAAVRARDGRGPRTSLERLVPAAFGLSRPIDVTRAIEAGRIGHPRIRELSPVVFRAAGAGDPVARAIVDRLADELAVMAIAIIRRLSLARKGPDVILAGGVFAADDRAFEARIAERIQSVAPGSTIKRSDSLPVLGAALLALDRLAGLSSVERRDADARLRSSLGAWRPGR